MSAAFTIAADGFVPSANFRRWRDAWPLPAQERDGNAWATGACMLYCRRRTAQVTWIGRTRTPGAVGPMYACGDCLAELDRLLRLQGEAADARAEHVGGAADWPAMVALTVPPYRAARPSRPAASVAPEGTSGGRHRRSRRRFSFASLFTSLFAWLRHG